MCVCVCERYDRFDLQFRLLLILYETRRGGEKTIELLLYGVGGGSDGGDRSTSRTWWMVALVAGLRWIFLLDSEEWMVDQDRMRNWRMVCCRF